MKTGSFWVLEYKQTKLEFPNSESCLSETREKNSSSILYSCKPCELHEYFCKIYPSENWIGHINVTGKSKTSLIRFKVYEVGTLLSFAEN